MREHLYTQLDFNVYIAGLNLAGLTDEESRIRAVPDGSSIHFLVAHLLKTRGRVLPALGEAAPAFDEETISIDELRQLLEESAASLRAGIARATDEQLAGPPPFTRGGGADTFASMLIKIFAHETYHIGQIGILRRIAGKEGVIK